MRFVIASLVLMVALPEADAAGGKGQCKNQCNTQYQFCLNRSRTKQARNSCKTLRKACRGTCRG
jgi:hypothetical protein